MVYRIVDEYGNKFILKQKTSKRPLSMNKVIQVLDTAKTIFYDTGEEEEENVGLMKPQIIFYKDEGVGKDEVVNFINVSSPFYPDLEQYYEKQKLIWFDE